jgi:hypothetical protein
VPRRLKTKKEGTDRVDTPSSQHRRYCLYLHTVAKQTTNNYSCVFSEATRSIKVSCEATDSANLELEFMRGNTWLVKSIQELWRCCWVLNMFAVVILDLVTAEVGDSIVELSSTNSPRHHIRARNFTQPHAPNNFLPSGPTRASSRLLRTQPLRLANIPTIIPDAFLRPPAPH